MKTFVKPLIQVHLENRDDGNAESIGVAVRKVDDTPADLCLNGYRMLLHCQGASSDASHLQETRHSERLDHKETAVNSNRNTTPKGR